MPADAIYQYALKRISIEYSKLVTKVLTARIDGLQTGRVKELSDTNREIVDHIHDLIPIEIFDRG